MTEPQPEHQHWLTDALRRANAAYASTLDLPASASPDDAWRRAATHCNLTEDELAAVVGRQFGLAVADLHMIDSRALRLVPEASARKHQVVPIRETDRQLVVATANPLDLGAEQSIGFSAGRTVTFEIAPPSAIAVALDDHYLSNLLVDAMLAKLDAPDGDLIRVADEDSSDFIQAHEFEAAPIVRLANLILQHAVGERASDVHFEPGSIGGHVRFRIDGAIQSGLQMPMSLLSRVASNIKALGNLDLGNRERAQEGRARIRVGGRPYDLRISTVPNRGTEKVVVRLLEPGVTPTLESLDMPAPELARLRDLLVSRDGMIIVTGPTGSGKTTTLYAMVRELSKDAIRIMTVEDSIEHDLPGVTQVQLDPKDGTTFATALRAVAEQDPDVIYIGEIRDPETAEVAARAALKGHLVVAALHTNDAVGVVHRLSALGLEATTIATALRGVVSQRLVRKLCPHCSRAVHSAMTPDEVALAARHGIKAVRRPSGCKRCGSTGYRDRAAVAEVLVSAPPFAGAVARGSAEGELDALAKGGGMRPIRRVAADLVAGGVTSIQELDRVIGGDVAGALAVAEQPHVLVTDDDELIRALARAVLEKGGMRVSEAANGEEALSLLAHRGDFSLVLLDIEMPRLGGFATLQAIRSKLATAGLPVVILTGSDSARDETRMVEAGADDYVRKPIVPDRLLTRVKSVLSRAGSS